MARRNKRIDENENAEVDMTPMLDIVFILLIFFIVTTSFVKEQGFLVEKVKATKSPASAQKSMTIHIDENDTIFFNNKMVDIERLPARIEYFTANNPTDRILFRPDKNTNYQKVVEVLDQIKPFSNLKISIGIYKP